MTSATPSYVLQNAFAFEDMRRHAAEAFGLLGGEIADTWRKFNTAYFNDTLRPIPLIVSQTLPFGRRIGQCSHNRGHYQAAEPSPLTCRPTAATSSPTTAPCCTRCCTNTCSSAVRIPPTQASPGAVKSCA
jgi:hypothetical protein